MKWEAPKQDGKFIILVQKDTLRLFQGICLDNVLPHHLETDISLPLPSTTNKSLVPDRGSMKISKLYNKVHYMRLINAVKA